MLKKILVSLLWLQLFLFCDANVDLSFDDNGFLLKFHEVEILSHKRSRPLMSVAFGKFSAEVHLGNFELEDLISDVTDLTEWTINKSNGTFEIKVFNPNLDQGMILSFPETEDEFLELKFRYIGSGVNRFFLRLPSRFDERIWGGGEQFTYLNLRKGPFYPIWVREQGVGRNKSSLLTQIMDLDGAGGDYHTSYWPQPSFLSSRGYHFELDIQTYSEMSFVAEGQNVTENDRHVIMWHQETSVESEFVETKATFVVAPTLMEIVQSINPGQVPVPDWALQGAILGLQGGTDRMLQILDEAKQNNVSVSAVWIQDWCGKLTTLFGKRVFWNWKWSEEWYPRLDSLIHSLASEGIKVLSYINPHLNIKGDIYLSEEKSNFWIKDSNMNNLNQDFGQFKAATVDIIKSDSGEVNPGRDWYKKLIKENLIDFGFAGWMADFGEYLPLESYSTVNSESWGKDKQEILHQTLGENWSKLIREVIEETSNLGEILVWHRSGTARSKYDVIMSWAGDQAVDWTASDGLKSSIVAALSLAVSGTGLSHSDIGGYTTASVLGLTRSKELLLRWAEYSVFTPLMRTHEGNQPDANHQVYTDPETFKAFGRLTQIFAKLFKYSKATMMQNFVDHMPVMRPLFLMFEDDEVCYDIEYQYMFGDDLLVAPVTEPDVVFWKVYLPKSDQGWIWLWDPSDVPDVIPGGSVITVQAPLGKPPVFFKEKSEWIQLFREIEKDFNFS